MVENNFKNMFIEELANMAEEIVRGKPPFNRPEFKIDPALTQYMSKLNGPEQKQVMDALIFAQKDALGCYRYFDQKKNELLDAIWLEINKNKGYDLVESIPYEDVKNRKSILIKIMKERKEGFLFDKAESYKGYIGFSKEWLHGKNQLIGFDVGVKIDSIMIHLGIKEPHILTYVASFFNENKAYDFPYHNEKEFIEAAHQALDSLDLIFPHYFERAEKVLSEMSGD